MNSPMTDKPMTNEQLAEQLRDLLRRVSGKCTNEEAGRWCLGFIVQHADDLDTRLAQQPARGGEVACWTWVHPDGDSGGWWDIRVEPEGSPYMQKMRSEGCRIEYAYRALAQQPARGGEVDAEKYRKLRSIRVNPYAVLPVGAELDAYVDALVQPRTELRARELGITSRRLAQLMGKASFAAEADRFSAQELVNELRDQVRRLQAFKDYVHKRLDDAGIPENPLSVHSEAGCRIGGRLDIALEAFMEDDEYVEQCPDGMWSLHRDGTVEFFRKAPHEMPDWVQDKMRRWGMNVGNDRPLRAGGDSVSCGRIYEAMVVQFLEDET